MYIRKISRQKDGKRHAYWALVESRRTARGPRQYVVAYLGELDAGGRLGFQMAAEGRGDYQCDFLEESKPEWIEIDIHGVRTERVREFGDIWLALELIKRLGLDVFLHRVMASRREEVGWTDLACVLIIARFCNPSSELYLAEHYYGHTALADLLGIPEDKIHVNRLYRALDKLLPHKESLETHLKKRYGELFKIEYDLLLYDVTSTYFEGEALGNPQAKRGYSRDKRGDCKQVCIALVVTREGIPLGYEVFDGNRRDVTTVKEIVTKMEKRYGTAERIWVMDRGMISEGNLSFLKQGHRRYIIGTPRSELKKFERELLSGDWRAIREELEVQYCSSPQAEEESFILCRSVARKEKERAIIERYIKNIESGLDKLQTACQEGRLNKANVVERRIGKLLQRNRRAAGLFNIQVIHDSQQHLKIVHRKRPERREWNQLTQGCYLLRSNIRDWDAEDLWKAYIQLTDAEAAFRIHKSDLVLRPIWHQKEKRVQAHILVCFLAFVLWKCLAQMCKHNGLGNEPRKVLDEIGRIKLTDVILPTRNGIEIKLRCVTNPDAHQRILLQHLGLKMPKRLTKNHKM
jgi:transposase